ncbi:MAG TPA: AraC family transcriptional regulator [Mucilaginibacter sp.]|nr:AraC family transcriptional regulator [Mucilaginibacter sp.]
MESRNFILTGSSAKYYWKGEGLCSVKTFSNGPAYYNTGKGSFKVTEDAFLLLNDGTTYAIEIDQNKKVDSFCLFFDQATLNEAFYGTGRSAEYLLDNVGHFTENTGFFERTYPITLLDKELNRLHRDHTLFNNDSLWLEQEFANILDSLCGLHLKSLADRNLLQAAKSSTRQELYVRLLKAREYIHANSERTLTLKEIALASHLSVNHLMRCFKLVFHATPHAYLTNIKIKRARHLLIHTDQTITGISEAVGYTSLGSFSLLFKHYTGLSPEAFRKNKNR